MAISLTWLKNFRLFSDSIEKLSLERELNDEELEFMLSCVILLVQEYEGDKRKTPYFQLAYYIVLCCAVRNKIYEPLLDISSNFGFYPITNYLLQNNLLPSNDNLNFSLGYKMEKFEYNGITETLEQKNNRVKIVESQDKENCYVAPTSFGKSSLILELIRKSESEQIAIIVPTKSLLIQTYKLVKSSFPNRKIIFHDEMYDGSKEFIAVFTQERALRLLKNDSVSFDLLIIDEAHNLFEMDGRSVLLTRLVRRNRFRNPCSVNYYLSPLISDADNLRVNDGQIITSHKVINNIKEPDIHELTNDGCVFKYNRFLNEFYLSGKEDTFIEYIVKNSKNKNFLYLRSPRKIEQLAKVFESRLECLDSESLLELAEVVSKNVHEEFYCVDYLKKGLIYLHGKLPDLVKEYLEHKFSIAKEVKFVIANAVILEGVNLPIDNLYVLNTYNLDSKAITNLIGRVNRLNEVFGPEGDLEKLLPRVHFINSDEFNMRRGNMRNKIVALRSGVFKDVIKNPLLMGYDFTKDERDLDKSIENGDVDNERIISSRIKRYDDLIDREEFLVFEDGEEDSRVKRILMESTLSSTYKDSGSIFEMLEDRASLISFNASWDNSDIMDKIHWFFIHGFENEIIKKEFLRLKNPKAKAFYRMFIEDSHRLTLKAHITKMVKHFQDRMLDPDGAAFYIGDSYGEFSKENSDGTYGKKVYIDLRAKSYKQLVNIALVKIKIESDFVSYKLNEYVNVLKDLGLISQKEYDLHIYGTENKLNSDFVKLGLSGSLINRLDHDKQMENLSINKFGTIEFNSEFIEYINKQDDLMKFEVSKYIDIA
ncbi:DEAD/DEAH box helicase [Ferrimonas sp.]|uniref:DEAD/DEAH box helicase n=1 Tax=Ferrimonas sp. TaxID=2080861 RepID=UPI003A943D1F